MLFIPTTLAASLQTNLVETSNAGRAGVSVAAGGTAHQKGSWVSLLDPTAEASYGIYIHILDVSDPGSRRDYLVDIAYGPTAGGSEQIIIPNINAGTAASGGTQSGKQFFVPIYIPKNTRVSARAQSNVINEPSLIGVHLAQDAVYPWSCGGVVDYGTDLTQSRGTSVTPGIDAWGTWAQLSAGIARNHRFWACAMDQLGDTTIANGLILIELGIGPNSANVTSIFKGRFTQSGSEIIEAPFPMVSYSPVLVNTPLWTRIASTESEARGVIAYGMD